MLIGAGFRPLQADPLVDQGTTTYDPNTGLEWLDLNLTAGQSYNTILAGWNGYTTTQGYRFATKDEILALYADAGATDINSTPSGNVAQADLLLSLLGTTYVSLSQNSSVMFYDPLSDPATFGTPDYAPAAGFGEGLVGGSDPNNPQGFFDVPGLIPLKNYSSPEIASALVKVAPEPSTWMLLVTGLGLILFASRSFRRRAY